MRSPMSDPVERELAVFSAARRLPAEARAAYLDEACAGDAALRQRVEELLRASKEAGVFLEDPAHGAQRPANASISPTVSLSPTPGEKAGDRIGHYKLLQQIGEGGCGVVYMAEQEEPVRRRVALKVIKLGMDTKSVIARFEAERQALALMDHPNIAKVLEAGATDAGRPYFVMELVRGVKITEYCDENNLSTRERLELFIQVCHAVQHAHQKGIIHRDIKPSNILVASNDGAPVPKVIDFGIAKATQGRLTDQTLFTALEQFIGTPAYMSPEQAELTMFDVDTRTDIYSLGVLLYELLIGRTPFDTNDLLAGGLDAMRRTIREQEPERPSTRLSTMAADALTNTAKHRRTEAPRLLHLIRGDLDWIVMKALEKDRARRYETANGLATDIKRHLDNEPVVARPPSNLYRFQKLARRNKLAFAAVAAVAAALVAGLGLSAWQFVEKSRAYSRALVAEQAQARLRQQAEDKSKRAQTEAAKSQQVAQFLKDMLQSVGPSVAMGRDTMMLREILDKTGERIGSGLTNQPEVEAELRNTLGEVYEALAEGDKAEAMHRQALALRRKALGNTSLPVAESLNNLSLQLHHQSRYDEAEAALQEALRIEKELLSGEHSLIAESLTGLAYLRLWQHRLEESENLFRGALAMRRNLYGNEHIEVANNLNNLALAITASGRLAEAESTLLDSLAMKRRLVPQDNESIAMTLYNLADALERGKSFEEAAAAFRESLTIRRKVLGDKHAGVRFTSDRLEAVLAAWESNLVAEARFAQAEPVARERVALLEKQFPDDWRTFNARTMLGGYLVAQGKLPEAEPLLLSGYEGMHEREHKIPTNAIARLVEANERIVRLYELSGRVDKAAERKKWQELAQAAARSAPEVAARRASGASHAQHGHFTEAAADLARVIELRPDDHEVWHWHAAALLQSGQLDTYHELRRKAVQRFANTTDPNTAERITKDFLILPSSGADLETAAKMAQIAVDAPTNHPDLTWFQFAKGLAEYRLGHFASAVGWTQKVLFDAGHEINRDAEACLVLAMAQDQLRQTNEARATFARALEIVAKMPKLDSGDLGEGWTDWVFAHALLDEAKALIDRKAATPEK